MGCVQTSPTVNPLNHVPIPRIYDNEPIPMAISPSIYPLPITPIQSTPTPFVKGVLKKGYSDPRGRSMPSIFSPGKPMSTHKTVNFDQQVLVKPRTPTPNKAWYEKESSTMPMRKSPRNDDDDDDDQEDEDEENQPSGSSHDKEIDAEWSTNSHPLPTLGRPVPILSSYQNNSNWYANNSNSETFPSPYGNRIKVRRRLSNADLLPTLSVPSHRPATSYSYPIHRRT